MLDKERSTSTKIEPKTPMEKRLKRREESLTGFI
jgi:hypothetical protein